MKICIIGNGLTSLVLAKNLAKKKIFVDKIPNRGPGLAINYRLLRASR